MSRFFINILFFLIVHSAFGQNEYIESTISRNNFYSFKSYALFNENDKNLVISPFGISSAMAMSYIGSEGYTAEIIAQNMNYITQFGVLFGFKKLIKDFQIYNSTDVNLHIGNALWSRSDIVLQKKYKNLLKVNFAAHVESLDLIAEDENSSKTINRWVKKESNYNVLSLVVPENFKKEDQLILTNFISLNGNWENPFNEQFTNKDDFYENDSTKIKVDFMNQTSYLKYNENDIFQIIELPYAGRNISMIVILPKTSMDLDSLEKNLNSINFDFWTSELYLKLVGVAIPKFRVDFLEEVSSILSKNGLEIAFSDKADFSRICKDPVNLSKIIQRTSIIVEENKNGNYTEQTSTFDQFSNIKDNQVMKFNANRPFLFIVKDNVNESVLLLGKIISPNFSNLSADYNSNN